MSTSVIDMTGSKQAEIALKQRERGKSRLPRNLADSVRLSILML